MTKVKYPDWIIQKLRMRLGLEHDDTSQDEEIKNYSSLKVVREMAAWELGDPRWADTFLGWLEDAGCIVKFPSNKEK